MIRKSNNDYYEIFEFGEHLHIKILGSHNEMIGITAISGKLRTLSGESDQIKLYFSRKEFIQFVKEMMELIK